MALYAKQKLIAKYIDAQIHDISFRKYERPEDIEENAQEIEIKETAHLKKIRQTFGVDPKIMSKNREYKLKRSQRRMVKSVMNGTKIIN